MNQSEELVPNTKPRNDKGQAHGYWESYWDNGNPWYKGSYHNNKQIGYWRDYSNNKLLLKTYFII